MITTKDVKDAAQRYFELEDKKKVWDGKPIPVVGPLEPERKEVMNAWFDSHKSLLRILREFVSTE